LGALYFLTYSPGALSLASGELSSLSRGQPAKPMSELFSISLASSCASSIVARRVTLAAFRYFRMLLFQLLL
jgi:hypothetical protein